MNDLSPDIIRLIFKWVEVPPRITKWIYCHGGPPMRIVFDDDAIVLKLDRDFHSAFRLAITSKRMYRVYAKLETAMREPYSLARNCKPCCVMCKAPVFDPSATISCLRCRSVIHRSCKADEYICSRCGSACVNCSTISVSRSYTCVQCAHKKTLNQKIQWLEKLN